MTDTRERWALILGASSGMGEATARALAAAGDNICGIHLDFRAALTHVEELKTDLAGLGRKVLYINMNAADDEKRAAALDQLEEVFAGARAAGREPYVHVVMHSLAFGSLVPFLTDDPKDGVDRKKMEMTQDVMANSLVYWVQDLVRRRAARQGLADLRDDLRGLDPGRAVVRRRVIGEGGPREPRPPAGDGAGPEGHGRDDQRDPGRGHRSRRRSSRSPSRSR